MNDYMKKMDEDYAAMVAKDRAAKAAGTLVGRYFNESCADSYAYYEVIKVTPRTCTLRHLAIYDGWDLPRLGRQGTEKRAYVERVIAYRDRMEALFAERKKGVAA